jgi:cell division protein FtsL
MAKKSAIQKIEDHEKLCRIMQKQTFDQIKEVKDRITRIEKMIIGGGGAIILTLIINMLQ